MSDTSDDDADEYDTITLVLIAQSEQLPTPYQDDESESESDNDESDDEEEQSDDDDVFDLQAEKAELEAEVNARTKIRDERETVYKQIEHATHWSKQFAEILDRTATLESDNKNLQEQLGNRPKVDIKALESQIKSAEISKEAAEAKTKEYKDKLDHAVSSQEAADKTAKDCKEQSESEKAQFETEIEKLATSLAIANREHSDASNDWRLEKSQLESQVQTLTTSATNANTRYNKESEAWKSEKEQLDTQIHTLTTNLTNVNTTHDQKFEGWQLEETRLKDSIKLLESNAGHASEKHLNDGNAWQLAKSQLEKEASTATKQYNTDKLAWDKSKARLAQESTDAATAHSKDKASWDLEKQQLQDQLGEARRQSEADKVTWKKCEDRLEQEKSKVTNELNQERSLRQKESEAADTALGNKNADFEREESARAQEKQSLDAQLEKARNANVELEGLRSEADDRCLKAERLKRHFDTKTKLLAVRIKHREQHNAALVSESKTAAARQRELETAVADADAAHRASNTEFKRQMEHCREEYVKRVVGLLVSLPAWTASRVGETLEEQAASHRQELDTLQRQYNEQSTKIETLMDSRDQAIEGFDTMTKQHAEQSAEIDTLTKSRNEAVVKFDTLTQQHNQQAENLANVENSHKQSIAEFDTLEQQHGEQSAELVKLTNSNKRAIDQHVMLEWIQRTLYQRAIAGCNAEHQSKVGALKEQYVLELAERATKHEEATSLLTRISDATIAANHQWSNNAMTMVINQVTLQQRQNTKTLGEQHKRTLRTIESELERCNEKTKLRDQELAQLKAAEAAADEQLSELEATKKKIELRDRELEQLKVAKAAADKQLDEVEAAKKRALTSLKGSENGRRAAIAGMNARFGLKPDDWADKAEFNQDLQILDKFSFETSVVARTVNRLNLLFDVVEKYRQDHDDLVTKHDSLVADHQVVQEARDTLATKLVTLTAAAKRALDKGKFLIRLRETTIASQKSDLELLATNAKAVQESYELDCKLFAAVSNKLATKLQATSEAVAQQAATIQLLQQFVAENADKFQ